MRDRGPEICFPIRGLFFKDSTMTKFFLAGNEATQRERELVLREFFNRFLVVAAEGKRPLVKPLLSDLTVAGMPVSPWQIRSWATTPWGQRILDECFGDSRTTAHSMLVMNLPNMLQKMIDEVLEGGSTGVSAFRALTPWFEHADLLPRSLESSETSAAGILLARYKEWVKLKEESQLIPEEPAVIESAVVEILD
jgi:hypothetical protein